MSTETTEIIPAPQHRNGVAPAPRTPPQPAPPPEQYAVGFDGMATQPFPSEVVKALLAPIDPEDVEIKPDGIVYLPGVWYRRRLTAAFGPGGWALAPRGPARTMGELVTYHGALYALGRFVSEAVGECMYRPGNRGMTYAQALEGARTDALTRCAKDLGIATDLWDAGWREEWMKKYAQKEWREDRKTKEKKIHWTRIRAGGRLQDAEAVDDEQETQPQGRDTGEALPEAKVAAIAGLALQDLGWAKPKAVAWLKKHFGVDSPGALSAQQGADVERVLRAYLLGEAQGKAALAELVAAGRAK